MQPLAIGVKAMTGEKDNLVLQFHIINRLVHNRVQKELDFQGLSNIGQPLILRILTYQGESGRIGSQKELAEALRVSPAAIAASIKRMVKIGLVQKINAEDDLRVNQIVITEKGKEILVKSESAFRKSFMAMYAGFSQAEKEQLASYYARIVANLEK